MQKNKVLILILALALLVTGCSNFADDFTTNIAESILESTREDIPEEPEEIEDSSDEPIDIEEPVELQVHFIDVGQGDSILIQTPSSNVLIDGGERNSGALEYLKGLNLDELDIVIGTHAHSDHIGGLINIINSIKVQEVIDPGAIHTTKTFEEYLIAIDGNDIKFTEGRKGLTRDLGDNIELEILHPTSVDGEAINNTSIVTKLTHNEVSFLFTGDAETQAEKEILSGDRNLKSTILKAGHHGSNTSNTESFLKAVDPEVVVITVGENRYGHPHEDILDRVSGLKTYRTDHNGNVIISTDGESYEVEVSRVFEETEESAETPVEDNDISDVEDKNIDDKEGKLNINTATQEELQSLPGIGSAISGNIIDYRENKKFDSIEELMNVKGIGPARFEKIKELITVGGRK